MSPLMRLLLAWTIAVVRSEESEGMPAVPGKSVTTPLKDPTTHPNWKLLDTENCGLSQADRIIGGQDAALGAYPWIVRVGYLGPEVKKPLFRCGAVLINKYYITTAAHCVTNLPRDLHVGVLRIGEHNTGTDPDCEDDVCADPVADYYPAEVLVHADYGKPQFKNDIALIRTVQEVVFGGYASPICMIHRDLLTKNYVDSVAEVAGWGIFDIEQPKSSVVLQTIKLGVVNNSRCVDAFHMHAEIGPTQMCVGGVVGQDSCGGDSGGPLMKVEAYAGPPRYFLLGIVSFGAKRCGATTMPGVYTRMSSYLDWVLENMHE